jgi:hypothetical protein
MFESPWAYAFPLAPVATRSVLAIFWHWLMFDELPEAAQHRDANRAVILALAGFSFTAVAGLAVLDTAGRSGFQLSIWYVLLSFVSYLTALNLQSYKVTRWQNYIAAALIEVGSLSLTLTLVSLVLAGKFDDWFRALVAVVAVGCWAVDHFIRLYLENSHFVGEDMKRRKGRP